MIICTPLILICLENQLFHAINFFGNYTPAASRFYFNSRFNMIWKACKIGKKRWYSTNFSLFRTKGKNWWFQKKGENWWNSTENDPFLKKGRKLVEYHHFWEKIENVNLCQNRWDTTIFEKKLPRNAHF